VSHKSAPLTFASDEIVRAILQDDHPVLDAFTRVILPQIKEYLSITVRSNAYLAEECAQQALFAMIDRVKSGHYDESTNVIGYLMISARNEFFKTVKKEMREGGMVLEEQYMTDPAEQYTRLVDKEREDILRKCLDLLDVPNRTFIQYYMDQPDASYLTVSKLFKISPILVRVRKSRLLARLHTCYKKKSAQ
jgi:RNA polymerase sigma factor (sigma-70 family)